MNTMLIVLSSIALVVIFALANAASHAANALPF